MNIDEATQALGVSHSKFLEYIEEGIIGYEEVPDDDGNIRNQISDVDIKLLSEIMKEQAERRHCLIEMIMPPAPSEEDGMDVIDGIIDELGSAIKATQSMIVILQSTSKTSREQSVHAVLQSSERIRRAAQDILNRIESMMGREPPVDEEENGKIRAREKALRMMLQDALPDFQSQMAVVLPKTEKKTNRAADAWADVKGYYEVVRSGVLVEVKKEEKKDKDNDKDGNGKKNE